MRDIYSHDQRVVLCVTYGRDQSVVLCIVVISV